MKAGATALAASRPCTVVAQAFRPAVAQQPPANPLAPYIKVQAPVVALVHARVIDGTGAAAREDQTIVIRDGNIAAIGDAARIAPPPGATVIDLTGKSVIPGLVMLHEHLYYTTGPGVYGQLGVSFSRLYLAGGVTTMRTAGNVNGIMDINVARRIAAGEMPGPAIDPTAPVRQRSEHVPADARRREREPGAHPRRLLAGAGRHLAQGLHADLARRAQRRDRRRAQARDEDHRPPVLGDLRRGGRSRHRQPRTRILRRDRFRAPTSSPTSVPARRKGQQTIAALDENGEPFKALVKKLVDKHVALTSTLTVFETFTRGRPMPPGLDVLTPQLKASFERAYERASQNTQSVYATLFPNAMRLERAFVKAGGTLVAGTDPTGAGGVVPGYADQRQIELLVEAGFTPLEAISIGTLNGAKYLGRDARIGSIALGKQADLVVVAGNPATTISDIRKVETVFKQGVGFDPAKLIDSVKGQVGIW